MMCKRNNVIFLQQFVVPDKHPAPHILTSRNDGIDNQNSRFVRRIHDDQCVRISRQSV